MNRKDFNKIIQDIEKYVNWTKVAETLNVHVNTVSYRLKSDGEPTDKMLEILQTAILQLRETRSDLTDLIEKVEEQSKSQ